jgi:enamine deaminase RidA (YjgF/YER057c/UK114 family)
MEEYKGPLTTLGLRTVNSLGLGSKLSSLLHISSAVIIPPNTTTVVTSGTTGYTNDMTYPDSIFEEIELCFKNVQDSLHAAGVKEGFEAVFSMKSFHVGSLDDEEMMEALGKTVEKYFKGNRPAWAGLGVASLYGGARIEIMVYAVLKQE